MAVGIPYSGNPAGCCGVITTKHGMAVTITSQEVHRLEFGPVEVTQPERKDPALGPLEVVRRFVNSRDVEEGTDQLG